MIPDIDLTDRTLVVEQLKIEREWGTDVTPKWILTSPTGRQVIAWSEDPEALRKWARKKKAKRVEVIR